MENSKFLKLNIKGYSIFLNLSQIVSINQTDDKGNCSITTTSPITTSNRNGNDYNLSISVDQYNMILKHLGLN